MRTFLLGALVCVATLSAQELAPELAPLVAKYKADIAALEAQKAVVVARAQQQYSTALDGAEKTAAATGGLNVVAAVTKEREAVKSGLMAPAFPAELPKTLQTARKACLDGVARATADLLPRRKAADADYLRGLVALQPKAAANPGLAQQIATEKENLINSAAAATAVAPGGAQSGGRSAVINGKFDLAESNGLPSGWRMLSEGSGATFKVVREGANSLVRVTTPDTPIDQWATQMIPVPPRAKSMTVRGRVRGKLTAHSERDSNYGANISARFAGSDEQLTGPWLINIGGREAGAWKTLSKTIPVEPGAKSVRVQFGVQWAAGSFDFDDIEVDFR